MLIELSREDLERLIDALDSHTYWQLSEEKYRNSGFVYEPGSDDEDVAGEIVACEELSARLQWRRDTTKEE